jgi:hypothetical protein
LKAETACEIVAVHDQALQTKYYATKILYTGTDSIISACPILANKQYTKGPDRVCAELHFNICKETGVKLDKEQWYEHVLKSVERRQDNNEKGTCTLTDIAISVCQQDISTTTT